MKAVPQPGGGGVWKPSRSKQRSNYIRQLSLEVVCSSLHDSSGTSQISCTELLTPPRKEAARVVRRCALCQDVRSVGGDAVAIFNTGASKTLKLSVAGLGARHA